MRKKFLIEQLAALKKKREDENARLLRLAAEGTAVPQAEVDAYLSIDGEIAPLQTELDGINRLEEDARRRVEQSAGTEGSAALGTQVHNRAEDRPYRNMGEFLLSVAAAGAPNGVVDPRLRSLAPSGASEGVPGDGGFLVREEYAALLHNKGFEMSSIASRCRRIPLSTANRLKIPIIDETSRATGSRWGGVQVYRTNEAGTATAKKPKFDMLEMALEKLMGLAYATEELLADAAAIESVFTQAFTEEFAWTIDNEVIDGDGAGKMLGILNAPALITVNKEAGQAAATVVFENIVKMYTRMPIRSRGNAAWFINQDIEPQLYTMTQAVGTTSAWPVFLPPGGASSAPYATLFGRPVIPIEQTKTLGTKGDLLFMDPSQYIIIERSGAPRADQSMHVRFLYDEMTFRWTMRNNGQPGWKSAITPANGSATVSPFIALQTRS